jgi:hypothetical protein
MQRRQRAEFANAGCRILIAAESKNDRPVHKQLAQRHATAVLIAKTEARGLFSRSQDAQAETRRNAVTRGAIAIGRNVGWLRFTV